jgi:hypothetical protein
VGEQVAAVALAAGLLRGSYCRLLLALALCLLIALRRV